MVVGEALASGIPVLGSIASQAVMELVEDSVTGWRFDPLRPSTIHMAIEQFLASRPTDLERMGNNGRMLARRIDSKAVASNLADVISAEFLRSRFTADIS
jgi:glycosyltransferase involved in cell wall biosynthesis